jgi:Ca-activated chloride channel family protein
MTDGRATGRHATDRTAAAENRVWREVVVWVALLPVLGAWQPLERRSAPVEAGNALMKAGKAEEALGEYDKAAAEQAAEPGVHFDRGTALAALSRFDEAAQEFLRATEARDPALKSAAFYNLGNAFFKKDKYKEAFEAYKRSLTLDPRNARAKWNAELALQKQREEDQKKKDQKDKDDQNKKNKDKNKDKDKDKDKKEQDKKEEDQKDHKKDEPKKDDQKKDDQKKDQPKPPTDDAKNQDEPRDQPPPAENKSAEEREMESALDGLDKSPKDLEKQRALLRAVRRAPPTRDW